MPILVIFELEEGQVVTEEQMRLLLSKLKGTKKGWACQENLATEIKRMLALAEDADRLWAAFGKGKEHQWPREAGKALGMTPKQIDDVCEFWARDDTKYEYGVCVDLGWKVEEQDV